MPRQKNVPGEAIDPWQKFHDAQVERFHTLESFRDLVAMEAKRDAVQESDALFAELIRVAIEDYGIKQQILADKVDYSAAAISRWGARKSLPKRLYRPMIMAQLSDLLCEACIEQSKKIESRADFIPTGRASARASVKLNPATG